MCRVCSLSLVVEGCDVDSTYKVITCLDKTTSHSYSKPVADTQSIPDRPVLIIQTQSISPEPCCVGHLAQIISLFGILCNLVIH